MVLKKTGTQFGMKAVTKGDLVRMYWDEHLSQWQIATKLNVTQGAVYYWMKKYGIAARNHDDSIILAARSGRFAGHKNPRWTGGRHISLAGYVMVRNPTHPLADGRGYVKEHRLVWYEANGPIPKGWHIHHKNGDKQDNRISNLELMTHKTHRAVIPDLLKRISELEEKVRSLENEHKSSGGTKRINSCAIQPRAD